MFRHHFVAGPIPPRLSQGSRAQAVEIDKGAFKVAFGPGWSESSLIPTSPGMPVVEKGQYGAQGLVYLFGLNHEAIPDIEVALASLVVTSSAGHRCSARRCSDPAHRPSRLLPRKVTPFPLAGAPFLIPVTF